MKLISQWFEITFGYVYNLIINLNVSNILYEIIMRKFPPLTY